MDDFLPLDALERSFRYWWLVVLWVIVGGGAAWLIHTQLPPVYEARVVFYSSLDFKLTGKLTPLEEDKAIGLVQTVILSSPVMLQVVDDAQAQGIRLDIDALRKRAYVSRLSYQWELRLRNTDPAVAQTLANLWADRTMPNRLKLFATRSMGLTAASSNPSIANLYCPSANSVLRMN
jgi:uncharacterized protein involved in exopolysaccharide biosynthesis